MAVYLIVFKLRHLQKSFKKVYINPYCQPRTSLSKHLGDRRLPPSLQTPGVPTLLSEPFFFSSLLIIPAVPSSSMPCCLTQERDMLSESPHGVLSCEA